MRRQRFILDMVTVGIGAMAVMVIMSGTAIGIINGAELKGIVELKQWVSASFFEFMTKEPACSTP